MTGYPLTILLISILFCAASTVLMIMLKRSNSNQARLLTAMRTTLDARQNSADDQEGCCRPTNIFDDNLRAAELTTRLQQPRLAIQQGGYSTATPERYHYIRSMVEKGMSTREIAAMLSMSLHETTQLVTLIRVTQQHKGSDTPLPSGEIVDQPFMQPERRRQQSGPGVQQQAALAATTGIVRKSLKFARWLKGRAPTPYIRQQSGREPPPQPLPGVEKIQCHPLSGFT